MPPRRNLLRDRTYENCEIPEKDRPAYCLKVSTRYGQRNWDKYKTKQKFDIIVNRMEDINNG